MKKDELVNELLAEANRQSNETADLLNRAAEIIAERVRVPDMQAAHLAQPAQSVDVKSIREVINDLREWGDGNALSHFTDKLIRAISGKKE